MRTVIETSDEVDCEVDKERLSSSGDLKTNRDHLTRTAYTTVSRIMTQRTFFPNELRDVYVRRFVHSHRVPNFQKFSWCGAGQKKLLGAHRKFGTLHSHVKCEMLVFR